MWIILINVTKRGGRGGGSSNLTWLPASFQKKIGIKEGGEVWWDEEEGEEGEAVEQSHYVI